MQASKRKRCSSPSDKTCNAFLNSSLCADQVRSAFLDFCLATHFRGNAQHQNTVFPTRTSSSRPLSSSTFSISSISCPSEPGGPTSSALTGSMVTSLVTGDCTWCWSTTGVSGLMRKGECEILLGMRTSGRPPGNHSKVSMYRKKR